ncbi:putative disease resistance protein RGA3 [Panicum virgatum]|uniref:putative disease resistance protein RGA3 n=1 Tax=Panicum virgatum TaxID=38727 RepID=UPI0019D5B462|nr:putative disease resistance protein RGA3 [Panicum virgatum]
MLKSMLPTKKYLIVLDDMWEEGVDNLEKLKHMLQYGRKGSKIILTTRMQHVVDKLDIGALASQGIICPMRKSDQINLSILSDDDCWNVMRQTPFWQDEDLCGLEAIGRQIAKKCAGLPLLARSLGFLLSQHKSTEAWEDIRDKKIFLGMEENTLFQEPLERLMLRYYYMPLKFKLCFTYCAVYAKGFTIASDNLIQQWRALGYIQSIVDGKHCVDYLLGMSFLQISKTSQNAPEDAEGPIKVTMHDLVYDLATIMLGQQLFALNDPKELTQNSLEKNYCRHMQFINYQKQSIDRKKIPSKIRSLHFTECDRLQLQDKSFSKCKYLHVLDISECSIQGKSVPSNISLPSSIHQLMLLRYLDASGLPITSLPKSLHKLQNMQTLILSNCALETLPNNIGSLLNLCYLDLSGNSSLNKLHVSFGELSALWHVRL